MSGPPSSKELLELEHRDAFSSGSVGLLICNGNKGPLHLASGKKNNISHQDGPSFITAPPKSQVLGKVKDFLGIMAKANKELELKMQENPNASYDIEALSGNESEVIEMDLLLGIADLRTPEAIAAAEATVSSSAHDLNCTSAHQCFDTDDSSSEDSSEDEKHSDDDTVGNYKGIENMTVSRRQSSAKRPRASNRNKQPKIVAIN